MEKDFVVIGDINSILVFKLVGFDCVGVSSQSQARTALNKSISTYKNIYITDEYAKGLEDIISDTMLFAYPVVTVIPSNTQKDDYALKQIKNNAQKTLGVNLLFND